MNRDPIRIAVVGVGKIARDQHLPSIAANPDFQLVATVSHSGGIPQVPTFPVLEALLSEGPPVDALALCMPPQPRFGFARTALEHDKHVFLEKPPGATVSEVEILASLAAQRRATLFTSWHSRKAAGVAAAALWVSQRQLRRASIVWREDVRKWHPGQAWIWKAGGLGVFDPGINALSILTAVLPEAVFLTRSELVFPSNRDAPIAAELAFRSGAGLEVQASFDWRAGPVEQWDIVFEAADGEVLRLLDGGERIEGATVPEVEPSPGEYPALYSDFAALIHEGRSSVDVRPLQHVADAFLNGARVATDPFED
jgi:D-galactose 1-dehydrogenase